jgi:hypothetical protein
MSDDTTQQDDKAMPPASAGSRPVAWQLWGDTSDDGPFDHYITERSAHWDAERLRQENPAKAWFVVPLYRQPALTDAEREAIAWAINKTAQSYDDAEGGPIKREAMRGLLQRTK